MDESVGKRESHRRATRAALEHAAQTLFAQRGFAGTTVRDIADAAGVTERTFFRYFAGKEELILDDVLAWMPVLQQAIRDRPAEEPPLVAVAQAAKALLAAADRSSGTPSPLLLFLDGPPAHRVGPSARGFLLRLEHDLTTAIADRLRGGAAAGPGPVDPHDQQFRAELIARLGVAAYRSVLIHDAELARTEVEDRPTITQLLDRVIELVRHDA